MLQVVFRQDLPKYLGVGERSAWAPSHRIGLEEGALTKGIFEVAVKEMMLDLLHELGKPGIKAGCESVPEDIEHYLLQLNWHLLR